ncbi:hypothetical protein B0H10DRAFT_1951634 [Mycena sp. CBHHK59/15]|nr:hypothetical protein B0H10DRAFT_1951634 [Mycena sp. CBHHK59/15]
MTCRMRSGAQFSPYDLHALHLHSANFETCDSGISIEDIIQEALASGDRRAQDVDDVVAVDDDHNGDWEDEPDTLDVICVELSPLSSMASSLSLPPLSRPASPGTASQQQLTCLPLTMICHPSSEAFTGTARTNELLSTSGHDAKARCHIHPSTANQILTTARSPGASCSKQNRGHVFTLPEPKSNRCQLISWDGRPYRRHPEDVDWDHVVHNAMREMCHAHHK